jgi:tetratricopeptide (TPR) repeat protein
MLPYLTLPYRTLRRRPLTMLLIVFLFVAAGLAGVNLWAWHHFRAAEQALRQEDDVDGARHHISQCLRVWQGAETQFLAARIERLSGNFAEAEQHLNECIRRQHGLTEATEVETLLMRAQRENLHEVEAVLWKCLDADHAESLWIAQTLAQIYLRDSRLSSALRCLDRWLETRTATRTRKGDRRLRACPGNRPHTLGSAFAAGQCFSGPVRRWQGTPSC